MDTSNFELYYGNPQYQYTSSYTEFDDIRKKVGDTAFTMALREATRGREINLGEKFDPDELIFSKKTYDPRAQKELAEFINYFRGLSSSADLGISQRQRLIESIVLLAPRYRRAIAGLYAKLFSEDSFTRMEAQKALGRFIGGVTLTVVALQMMQSSFEEDSEEENLDTTKADFSDKNEVLEVNSKEK